MKKTLTVLGLVLVMLTSLVAGTLAVYNTTLDTLSGDVVAKSFDASLEGTLNFDQELRLSPGESGEFKFVVKNYNENFVSETDMRVELKASLGLLDLDGEFPGLVITGVTSDSSTATINRVDEFLYQIEIDLAKGEKIDAEFTVKVVWNPGQNDMIFAGSKIGNLAVFGRATQN